MKLEIEVPAHLESEIRELVEKRINKRSPGRPPLTPEKKALTARVKTIQKYYDTLRKMLSYTEFQRYARQEIDLLKALKQNDEQVIAWFERERPWEK